MTVEVKAKLSLDDAASAALARIKQGFSDVEGSSKRATQSMGFFQSMLSTLAAFNFVPLVRGAVDFASGLLEAAANARDADQAIAGLTAAVQGLPWEEAKRGAMAIGDEIDEIAISAGQSLNEVRAGFSELLLFTGASAEGVIKAKTQLEQLTTVANVLGMDVRTLAVEFGAMGDGTFRTRSRLFQLLEPTGIFAEDVKKASSEWAKLTSEERASALSRALEQISGQMAKATPTFHDLTTTLANVWQVTKERFAEPIIDVLIEELQTLIPMIREGTQGIEGFAKGMAEDVRRWVRDASGAIQRGFDYLKTHSEEIRQAIIDGANTAKSVVEFIIANKEAIAIAFGAKMALPAVMTGANVAGGIISTAASGVPALGIAAGAGGAMGAVTALGAFAAALGGVTLALWQFQKLLAETGGGKTEGERDQLAREEYFKSFAARQSYAPLSKEELAGFDHIRKQYVDTAVALGQSGRAAGEFADKAWEAHRALRSQVIEYEQATEAIRRIEDAGEALGIEDLSSTVTMLEEGWSTAMNEGRTGAAKYIASLIANSANLREAFGESAMLTADGFNTLAEQVKSQNEEFAKRLQERAAEWQGPKQGAETPKAGIHMSGGQTFNIKQDFRDQDPDRVAIVFERDIVRAAESRLHAITSSPFGT